MARIFKRGKCWYIDFVYRGKRVRQSLNTGSKKLAELALKNTEIQIAKEELNLASYRRIQFSKFCERFLQWYSAQNSKKSSKDYDNLFRSTIMVQFKDRDLGDITTEMIEDYKIERKKTVKPATVNKELTALRHLFNKAIQWNYLSENPLKNVKRLKVIQKRIRYLTLEEIDLVLKNCPGYLKSVLMIAIHAGLRKSEIFRLEWKDIDFDRNCITVTSKGVEHTKNYRNREIPMTGQLVEYLKQLPRNGGHMCSNEEGERYAGWFRRSLASTARRAGIERFTLHDLRHTFASHLVMDGVDLPTVKTLMGHADIKTTMIYAHLAPDHLKGAIKRLSRRFENGTN